MRFLLFGSDECYYALGGGHDLLGIDNEVSNLMIQLAQMSKHRTPNKFTHWNYKIEWWHIYDIKIKKIIMGSYAQPYNFCTLDHDFLEEKELVVKDVQIFEWIDDKWTLKEDEKKNTKQNIFHK